jgi:mRNA interferase RelE/StbE
VSYTVDLSPHARRQLRRLPQRTQDRILRGIHALADEPRPPDVAKLRATEDTYRIRVGDYRVVYEIHDRVLLVLVVEVAHRRDVYR